MSELSFKNIKEKEEIKLKEGFLTEVIKDLKKNNPDYEDLENYLLQLKTIKKSFSNAEQYLKKIPVGTALTYWLREEAKLGNSMDTLHADIEYLISKNILILKNDKEPFTLEDLNNYNHQNIIEEIRCIKDISLLKKEELVSSYIRFSSHLKKTTFGYIGEAIDPDREKVKNKEILYENFIDFVRNLPERDALIAKFLYFGFSSLEDLLNLKIKDVNFSSGFINYKNYAVKGFPKHLILDLKSYVAEKNKNDLIFSNFKGEIVERAHLNQSFRRASKKTKVFKITPGLLLKAKS